MIAYTMDIEIVESAPKMRAYAVCLPGDRGLRFMTYSALWQLLKDMVRFDLPDLGQAVVYNDLSPFGASVCWQAVDDGMSLEELIDSNMHGERVIHL